MIGSAMLRTTNGRLASTALVFGTLAVLAGDPPHEQPIPEITAIDLAERILQRAPDLVIIDLRAPETFAEFAVPTAQNVRADAVGAMTFAADAFLVLYADDPHVAARVNARLRGNGVNRVHVLRGGIAAWLDDVMSPAIPWGMTEAERARISEISRYFGGQPRLVQPGDTANPASGDVAGRVQSLRRRGCGI